MKWGKGEPRKVTSDENWRKPIAWARSAAQAGERRRVFCASLADVLDEEAPAGAQARLWDLIRETARVCSSCLNTGEVRVSYPPGYHRSAGEPSVAQCTCYGSPRAHDSGGLDWLLLTKRPERWRLIPEDVRPLVWLGTSVSGQQTADEWMPRLLAAEGFRLRFLSIEPIIGPINLRRWLNLPWSGDNTEQSEIQWVIVGGESGPNARPCRAKWVRSVIQQCRLAGVACFVKQLGANIRTRNDDCLTGGHEDEAPGWDVMPDQVEDDLRGFREDYQGAEVRIRLRDKKGGDPSEWPVDMRVREFPEGTR